MLKLKILEIANVGRFVGHHSIDFSSKGYLIQVDGQNKNTGGSSGSGKSTIFNSLEYLLGVNALPSTVLQSRLTKDAMSVKGVFDMDGKELSISRAKSGGLSISLGGVELVSGNNKTAEEKLDEIFGIPRDLLRKMIHKRQKEGGFFLNLTPKESHAFLISSLGLSEWSKKTQLIEEDIKSKNTQLVYASGLLESSKKSIENLEASLSSLQPPTIDFSPELIPILESSLAKAVALESSVQEKLLFELNAIAEPQRPDQNQDRSKLDMLRSELISLEAQEKFERAEASKKLTKTNEEYLFLDQKLGEMKRLVALGHNANSQLEDIKKRISTIKNGTCPTCKQQWLESNLEIENLVNQAKLKMLDMQKGKAAEDELSSVVSAMAEKQQELAQLRASGLDKTSVSEKISALKIDIDTESSRLAKELSLINQAYQDQIKKNKELEASIRQKYEDQIVSARYNVQEQTRLLAEKKATLAAYKQSAGLYGKNKESLQASLDAAKADHEKALKDKADTEIMVQVASDALGLIKSYTNTLFQDALSHIANKATDILSKIPNMSTATIYFEGFKETKSGTIKEEVSAIVTMDGEVGIPVKSMSGGERTAIDLAVDLAVIDMVEELAGKGIDMFILDEPFDGLDSICREQCLEILKTHITDKKIIVVDHSNETKELVSDRITVVREGNESSILN